MQITNLQDLFIHELKDIYNAEQQIIKNGPKVAKECQSDELRRAVEEHVRETEEQAKRLEQVLTKYGEKPRGVSCKGMQGVLEENKELMKENIAPEVLDAGLIVGLQKVEHYEIAGYGSVVTYAKMLGDEESARLLSQTLDEEKRTDKKLTELAERSINVKAEHQVH